METLLQFDQDLLLSLNSLTSPLFDNFFWVVTSKSIWVPLYAVILYVIFKNQGLKGFFTIIALAVMVALCDQISTNIFKEGFERLRPSRNPALEGVVDLINGKRGGKYGFVSSHATNSFGLAVFSLLLFRYRWYSAFILIWALLNSYSRIYMGVHYPGDILGGLILGSLIGWFVYWLYKRVSSRFMPIQEDILPLSREREFSFSSVSQIIFTGILIIVVIFLSAKLLVDLV
ncbi:phosphatase PAP2 family protein [Marinilabilia rubra]|uniref:Phospholipid phosphatase n=1 Tax=Marinilabilia rubra TaxID=2162893 RepID=A0A2U2BCI2_9BACT|nr:phosphatase PAP2 family protein [Marinilabilia rubra]PWE00784.1 phospholipid phosphatase [Marinilabilia rubra]